MKFAFFLNNCTIGMLYKNLYKITWIEQVKKKDKIWE